MVNDGSHDKTLKLLQVMYQLKITDHHSGRIFQSITHPELKVLEAPHMGKAGALNFGLRFTSYDLICTLDADTIPTARGIEACLKAFAHDSRLVAAGGVIQVLASEVLKNNSPVKESKESYLTSFQRIEYLRAFICERLGWSYLGSTLLISGAFSMIKKEAIQKISGFSPRSITEDFDLIVRLRKTYRGKNHIFKILPVTTCYTQVPNSMKHLSKQRMRWQMGLVQTLFQNSSLFLHPRFGILGMMCIPYFWLVEGLSPLMALMAWIVIPFSVFQGWIPLEMVLFYFFAGILFNMLITVIGISFDSSYVSKTHSWNLKKALFDTFLIHFGYKQMTTWWRLIALVKAMQKAPGWGEKPRMEIIHR